VFEQRAASQKGSRWRCYLDNTAIAVDLLPTMTGDLTSTEHGERHKLSFSVSIPGSDKHKE
jgi:hypothetical protein